MLITPYTAFNLGTGRISRMTAVLVSCSASADHDDVVGRAPQNAKDHGQASAKE
jgi:hypothetical protein